MTAEFDWDEIEVSEIIEGVTAVMLAPIVLPLAAGINQPTAKKTIKDAIAFSQRCKEAVAEARERFEDVLAEAQAEVDEEQQLATDSQPLRPRQRSRVSQRTSVAAAETMDAVSELNEKVDWLTNGYVDLRFLLPLGLGTLALGQLLIQGPQLDKIRWYNLAWYAFDSFNKLNQPKPETRRLDDDGANPTPAQLSRENEIANGND
ncbi:DUF5132 domain-containing protein [Myxosarcina sp. GI1(2024)]